MYASRITVVAWAGVVLISIIRRKRVVRRKTRVPRQLKNCHNSRRVIGG
jgi:hypothetical protein